MRTSRKEMAMAKTRNTSTGTPPDRRLGPLIDRLGPINNACRGAEGIDKLELLWDFGDALLRYDPEARDDLLWAIAQRSYMTRDLLRYALIIRRGWADRSELRQTFPRLTHYSLFREALPFLKGDRCGIAEDTYADVIARLNEGNLQETKDFLLALKTKKIGRKHKKGQAVAKMSEVAEAVRSAVQQLVDLASTNPTHTAEARHALGLDALLALSQWCMAVAEDGSAPPISLEPSSWPEPFATLGKNLVLVGRANRDDRAGFRKALRPVMLMEAADLLNSMRSNEHLEKWKRRRNMDLTL
jgi:hypothetical protein